MGWRKCQRRSKNGSCAILVVSRALWLGKENQRGMSASLLLPDTPLLRLDAVCPEGGMITLVLSTVQAAPRCPDCGEPAARVHSGYVRTPADLPCGGVPLRLELHSRRIFTERLPGVLQPYARRTFRLAAALTAVAHALGGKAGARLTDHLGMKASRDTLLRRLQETPPDPIVTPRVLGVDDWAQRKGQVYGTILVDLERRCVIDLLPDRRAETLAQWLKEHPGVEIIARDRGGAYAEGAKEGAPEAVQVADRFHLLQNLAAALEGTLAREQQALWEAAQPPPVAVAEAAPVSAAGETAPERQAESQPPTPAEQESKARRVQRQALFENVRRLYDEGYSISAIAQKLDKNRRTIRKYLLADAFPKPKRRQRAPGQLVPFQPYLEQRWREGCHNATQLWREIKEQGFAGARSAVKQLLSPWRAQLPPEERRTSGCKPRDRTETRAPAPRTVVWWLLGMKEKRTEEQTAYLQRLKEKCPRVEIAQSLALEFFAMARRRNPAALEGWIERAAQSGIEEVKNFGVGLRRDWDAVVAGLTLEWSSGPVEGQVNRLKMLKRQMFGRASLPVLRARIVTASRAA
jgi:transposase